MKTLTAALSSTVATLWLVATASAWPTPTAQQRAACQHACEDQLHQCISDAKDARNACRASCQPMQTTRQQACANGNGGSDDCQQAKIAMQDCTQSCEVQYRSDRDNCNQTAHDCKDQCSLAATDTPTPEEVPTDTPTPEVMDTPTNTPEIAPTETPTETPAPADTATNTPAPADTATNTPAPADTATNTPAPADTATNTPAPAATSTPTNTAAPADTATNTPAPADTATNTPAPTNTPPPASTATPTATNTAVPPTATNTVVPPTATDTPLPAATATNTAVPASPTPTPTETPAGKDLVCTFGSGTGIVINDGGVSVSIPLTGHSEMVFSPTDANGLRTISIPHAGTHIDCVKLPLNSGVACVRPDYTTDGFGVIDCTGTSGMTGYNLEADQDHNSNNGNDPGFDGDPSCTATFTEPDGSVSTAALEDGSAAHPHTGVCNSPVHITASGAFPAGGTHLSERQILRLITTTTSCSPNPCPPDDTAFDAAAGDSRLSLLIGTGHAGTTLHDLNNVDGDTLSGSTDGTPGTCADIDAGNLSSALIAGAFPGLDENVLGDSAVSFKIKCQ
jgi:hypothetical protein